jgi:hypothetical protein
MPATVRTVFGISNLSAAGSTVTAQAVALAIALSTINELRVRPEISKIVVAETAVIEAGLDRSRLHRLSETQN